jgi:hypothetical protein
VSAIDVWVRSAPTAPLRDGIDHRVQPDDQRGALTIDPP